MLLRNSKSKMQYIERRIIRTRILDWWKTAKIENQFHLLQIF